MVQRLKFKSTKFLKILWLLIRFNKIYTGSVFLSHPVQANNIPVWPETIEIELDWL